MVTVERWEYTHLYIQFRDDKKTLAKANELGREGWELIIVDGADYWFKRRQS